MFSDSFGSLSIYNDNPQTMYTPYHNYHHHNLASASSSSSSLSNDHSILRNFHENNYQDHGHDNDEGTNLTLKSNIDSHDHNGGIRLCGQLKTSARGHWKPAEDAKLKELVALYGPQNWNLIAEELEGRSGIYTLIHTKF